MKKEIKGLFYGVIYIIITDAGFVSIAIHHEASVSDYIIMGIFLPIINVLSLFMIGLIVEGLENKKLHGTEDNGLPKLK